MDFIDLGITIKSTGKSSHVCPKCTPSRKPEHQKERKLTANNEIGNRWVNCNHCGWSMNLEVEEKFSEVRKKAGDTTPPMVYSKHVLEFLDKKGISVSTARKLLIYEPNTGTLAYPYYKGYALVNVMYRDLVAEKANGSKKTWQIAKDLGTESVFWGLDSINHAAPIDEIRQYEKGRVAIIITEGQTDRATWYECGYDEQAYIISVPMGAQAEGSANEKALDYARCKTFAMKLKSLADKGLHVEIWIALDNDSPGRYTAEQLAAIFGKNRCKRPYYPSGYKDINEVFKGDVSKNLKGQGREGVEKVFKSFRWYPISGVIKIGDVFDSMMDRWERGVQRGLMTGIKEVDKHVSFFTGHIWAVTGVSGAGKSTWLRWYLMQLIKHNPKELLSVSLYTPEMAPPEREYTKLLELYCKKPATNRYNIPHLQTISRNEAIAARGFIDKNFQIVNPSRNLVDRSIIGGIDPTSLDAILKYWEYQHLAYGTNIGVIDAWNKLEHNRKGASETDYVSRELDKIHEFNEKYNFTTMIVAHPVKTEEVGGKFNNPNFKTPNLYNISGSANFKNKCMVGIVVDRKKYRMDGNKDETEQFIWKIDKNAPLKVIFEKIKFDEIGEEGYIMMNRNWKEGESFDVVDHDSLIIPNRETPSEKPKEGKYVIPAQNYSLGLEGDVEGTPF